MTVALGESMHSGRFPAMARVALLAVLVTSAPMSCTDSGNTGPVTSCDGVGCGPTPRCGEACTSPCGCCPCSPGEDQCEDGKILRCTGGCIAVETCSSPDGCFTEHSDAGYFLVTARCADSASDCDAVQRAYTSAIADLGVTAVVSGSTGLAKGSYIPRCSGGADCAVTDGHCAVGLPTCWFLGTPPAEVTRLAALYERLACPSSSTCNCPPRVTGVACEPPPLDGGSWFGPANPGLSACVVR